MKILVANLGSTSLKYRLFDFAGETPRLVTRGGFERVTDYPRAITDCLTRIENEGAIAGESDLAAVGFKTVFAQGITGCVELTDEVLRAMEVGNAIAPAHNPPYIAGIRLFAERLPTVPRVGLFETAFYQWAPEAAMRYAVPRAWHEAGIRRWGYHGASHKYVAERSAEMLGRDDVAERVRRLYVNGPGPDPAGSALRVISCHLGGSSSVTGIRNGVAVGNSLGLSPQSGLPHNNRVGDLDAFAVPYVIRRTGLRLEEAERVLCKESGLLGISGVSNDVRDLAERARAGDGRAQLALEVLVHQTRHWIGSYFLQLNGADALVFTAGIGENQTSLRAAICAELDQLGIELDSERNATARGAEAEISSASARVRVLVIPANEELVVAREVQRYLASRCAVAG